jgi:hypothetical protein
MGVGMERSDSSTGMSMRIHLVSCHLSRVSGFVDRAAGAAVEDMAVRMGHAPEFARLKYRNREMKP